MSARPKDEALFDGGPPHKLQSLCGLISPGRPNIARRIALVILIGWAPLAVLSAMQGDLLRADAANSFLLDFGAHARFLVAAPLLIFAEAVCLPHLGVLARSFLNAGLVAEADRGRFNTAAASTRRLLDSTAAEIAVVVLAYLLVVCVGNAVRPETVPAWHRALDSELRTPSLAGWWGLLVSLPVLLALQLGWLWRFILWARFLWLMSRLELILVPAHPDGAAGLRFVGYSAHAFALLGFAVGAIAAGSVANGVSAGASIASYKYFIGGFVACVVVLLNAPLLVFFGNLLREWRRGTLEYGALADRFGREFERKWFTRKGPMDESVLERQDFSAATDLYQVVDRVYAMWLVPVHLKSVVLLTLATLLPFAPVVLMAVSFDDIVNTLAGLLL